MGFLVTFEMSLGSQKSLKYRWLIFVVILGVSLGLGSCDRASALPTPTPTPAPPPTSTPGPASGGVILYPGPMIDAHSHPSGSLSRPDLIRIAVEEAGLEKVILFFDVSSLPTQASARIIPFVQFQRDRTTREVLINREAVRNIEQALESGKAKGIGELSLRHRPFREAPSGDNNPADQPLLLEIYDLAAKYRVPVTVHVEHKYAGELERALAHNREARIIWAHYGDASPQLLRVMMTRHQNLYADLSAINPIPGFRSPELAPADSEGKIKPEWKALFLEFPDRFVFGVDMGITERRYRNAPEVVEYYRKILGQLPTAVAKKIAHDNILALLGQ